MGLDYNEIKIKKNGNRNITVYYKDYEFNTTLNMESVYRKNFVPRIDSNGKRIGILLRGDLRNYLTENYDLLSLADDMIPVKEDEVKKYFTNLTICSEEEKSKFLYKKHSDSIYILFFIFLLLNFGSIIGVIKNHYLPLWCILCLIIPVILIILSFFSKKNLKYKDEISDVYSTEVYVYDRKVDLISDGDGVDRSYSLRVWDNDKHVLMRWFPVSKKDYDEAEKGMLFLSSFREHSLMVFEPNVNEE